jgi:hypothetical protein
MLDIPQIVQRCSPWEGYTFDPGTHIRAVNALYNAEKARVIAGVREYAHSVVDRADLVGGSTRLLLLLRLLFVPADPGMSLPPLRVGKPEDIDAPPLDDFPLYPLALIDDVPLLIVTGFMVGGLPEDPRPHVDFYERFCELRPRPLRPPNNPLPLAEALMTSPQWYRPDVEHDQGVLRAQLLRLVRAVYAVPGVDALTFFSYVSRADMWEQCTQTYNRLQAVWDEEKHDYGF